MCLGPLRYANSFLLVGDHYQLPPLVRRRQIESCFAYVLSFYDIGLIGPMITRKSARVVGGSFYFVLS